MQDKIIGVVGGMGSFATLDLFKRILLHYPAEKEWDRPRVIIDNYCTMPSRVRAILYHEREDELIEDLTTSITNLVNLNCTDIILACNTSHYFLEKILENNPHLKKYVINIVDICIKKIVDSGIKEIYLVATEGTIATGLYTDRLYSSGVEVIVPDNDEQLLIRNFIECVKQNKIDMSVKKEFTDFINNIASDNVLLGCTEMPPLYGEVKSLITKNIIDPVECVLSQLDKRN